MNYTILTGRENIPFDGVMRLLSYTYWADRRPPERVRASMEHSDCFGVWLPEEEKLVGFCRVISDYATTCYLCDVIIDPGYQHQGLGTALIGHVESLPQYQGLRGLLITRDAHALYERFGFATLNGRAMVKGLNC